jgi:recombination protein RecT
MSTELTISQYLNLDVVKGSIESTLGSKSQQFIISLASVVNSNKDLADCNKRSLLNAALIAASLDLPVNSNLGYCHLVPYRDKHRDNEKFVQLQAGWKAYVQLALRTGQYTTINVSDVREGELQSIDYLTGEYKFAWDKSIENRNKKPITGYVSFFQLKSGFSKMLYMSVDELKAHATRYSPAFRIGRTDSKWISDFDFMGKKTVVALNLRRWGILSVEMQTLIIKDLAELSEEEPNYIDNKPDALLADRLDSVKADSQSLTMGNMLDTPSE